MNRFFYFILLCFNVTIIQAQHVPTLDLKSLFELDTPEKIVQKFGKENVQKVRPDMLIGDEIPFEYAIYKGTPNEFSIIYSAGNLAGVIVRSNYKGNILNIPYKAGLTLKELYNVNQGNFSFHSNLSKFNWYGGVLGQLASCIDIQLSMKDYIKSIDFQNKYSEYELFYNSPEVEEQDISVTRIVYYPCSLFSSNELGFGSFIDNRDGKAYRTIKIGNQIWMADNLAFKLKEGCKAYNNDNTYVAKLGYLYEWQSIKTACPAGWHVASDEEWKILIDYLGGETYAATKLKSSIGWEGYGNGTNETGLSLLPGGYYLNQFKFLGSTGFWWTSTESSNTDAWFRSVGMSQKVDRNYGSKKGALSVRCIKD